MALTIGKAIKVLKKMKYWDTHDTKEEEAVEMGIQALRDASTFRWHDIRKNPDDLPDEYEAVLATLSNSTVDVAVYCREYGFRPWYSEVFGSGTPEWDDPVIAWKRIEPYEATEEVAEDDE